MLTKVSPWTLLVAQGLTVILALTLSTHGALRSIIRSPVQVVETRRQRLRRVAERPNCQSVTWRVLLSGETSRAYRSNR